MAITVLQEDFDSISEWATTGVVSVRTGRTGVAERVGPGAGTMTFTIPGGSESDTVTVGFAWQISSISSNRTVGSLRSDAAATQHLTIVATSTGAIEIRRGTVSGTVLATTAAGVVAVNTWNYVELQAKLHDTTGFVTLRLNGTQVAAATAVDTKNAGTKTTFDSIQFAGATGIANTLDDLYLITGADGTFQGVQRFGTVAATLHEPFDDVADWTIVSGAPTIVAGRNGTGVNLTGLETIDYTIPSGQRSYVTILGFAIKPSALNTVDIVRFRTASGTVTAGALSMNSNGSIQASPNGASSAAGVLAVGTWAYVEVMGLFNDAGGSWVLRVNNTVVSTAIDTDTIASGSAVIDTIRLLGNIATVYDDLYIRTGTLADFEGDQVVVSGGTAVKQWNGTAFVSAPIKTWNGSAFVDAVAVKTWNGSIFV